MPSLASVLKDEIRRLARKETKAQVKALQFASTQHRRDIAKLKRSVAEQERQLARLQKRSPAPVPAASDTEIRFSPDWVANHRDKLGLSAADYAALVGVSHLTIYNWEKGKTRPQRRQLEAWAAVRKLGKREAWRKLEQMEA